MSTLEEALISTNIVPFDVLKCQIVNLGGSALAIYHYDFPSRKFMIPVLTTFTFGELMKMIPVLTTLTFTKEVDLWGVDFH